MSIFLTRLTSSALAGACLGFAAFILPGTFPVPQTTCSMPYTVGPDQGFVQAYR